MKRWTMAFLAAFLVAGCGDDDNGNGTPDARPTTADARPADAGAGDAGAGDAGAADGGT
jgi:hypothetical protein